MKPRDNRRFIHPDPEDKAQSVAWLAATAFGRLGGKTTPGRLQM
jgi:hypothetical protein